MAEQEWSTISASQALPEINEQNKSGLSVLTGESVVGAGVEQDGAGTLGSPSLTPVEQGGAGTLGSPSLTLTDVDPKSDLSEPDEGSTESPIQPIPPKRGKRKPASGAKASRPRQAKQHQAGTGIDGEAVSSSTPAKQKQSTRAKSRQEAGAAGGTRTAHSRKKQARVAEPLEPAHEFEPDVDATPVKPRETSKTERRTALFSDAGPEALPEETGAPFQAEETLKRPIARLHAPPDELPSPLSANGHRLELSEPELDSSQIEPQPDAARQQESVEPSPATDVTVSEQAPGIPEIAATPLPDTALVEQQDMPEMPDTPLPGFEIAEITAASPHIPETPVPPTSAEESIPETPFIIEEDTPPFLQDELFGVASMEPGQLPVAIAALDAPPVSTPAPVEIELVEAAASPVIVEAEIAPPAREEERKPPAPSKRRRKGRVAIALLMVLALCSSAIWHDVSDTHLYLYSINPLDGQVQAQQDLGGGYAHTSALTNSVLLQSSLLVGLPQEQRILSLTGGEAAWNVSRQVSAPLAHATLNVAPTQSLVIAYAGGVQVLTPGGKLLWQARGDGPALGAHAFAPAFDDTTLYTVKDARGGVIAAHDLRSGTMRWSQRLGDSFVYAPPFLHYGNTLFAAGDHTIYALNRTDGRLLWKASAPVRTLLLDKAGQPLLIAAGAMGLQAFDVQSGRVAWSFNGHPGAGGGSASLTVAQFYQAGISATNDVVYATGIVWDEQSARAQLWLYAVDASSGGTRWSEQISSDFASVDAGRVLAPSVDATLGMVLLEVARADGSHLLAAYNTSDGSLRWSTQLVGVSAFAPDLLQAAKTSINVFSVQADAGTALHNWSWLRLLLLMLGAASILLLLGLWLFPLESWPLRAWATLRAPLRGLRTYFRQIGTWRRNSRRARLLVACCLIALLVGASFLIYPAISRPQQYLNAVAPGSGSMQWQHALDTPSTLSGAGGQESFVVMKAGSTLSFLSALNSDGSLRWSTPASEGTYSLPAVQTAPGTLLVALSGPTSLPYIYSPGDPAYALPLAHLFTLSLRESATGRVLWQSALVRVGEAQDTTVLASDAQYTYVAGRSIPPSGQTRQAAVVQLIAIDTASGAIAWRFFGAREESTTPPDFGALLPHGRLLYWQVDGAVYAIDTQLGQIQWRRPLAEVNATSARLEEAQMALSGSVLLVRRSDRYHALDAATGNQLWSASGLGSATVLSPGGILATGGRFILYGNGTIEALDASSHALLWRHDNLANIPDAVIAADGSLVYAIVFDIQDSPTPRQALVAFDVKDSAVRWTFQPSGQVLFVYPGAPQLHAARGMLYVTLCLPQGGSSRCDSQVLYGINGATGTVAWKFGAGQVSAVQVSQGGSAVVFQTSSSPWENFKARFQG